MFPAPERLYAVTQALLRGFLSLIISSGMALLPSLPQVLDSAGGARMIIQVSGNVFTR